MCYKKYNKIEENEKSHLSSSFAHKSFIKRDYFHINGILNISFFFCFIIYFIFLFDVYSVHRKFCFRQNFRFFKQNICYDVHFNFQIYWIYFYRAWNYNIYTLYICICIFILLIVKIVLWLKVEHVSAHVYIHLTFYTEWIYFIANFNKYFRLEYAFFYCVMYFIL